MDLKIIPAIFSILSVCAPVSSQQENRLENNQTRVGGERVLDFDNTIDDSLESWEAPLEIRKNYAYYISGLDDDNRPILVCEFGQWDVRKIIEKGGQNLEDFEKYSDQAVRRFELGINSKELKHLKLADDPETGDGTVMIIDFEGFNFIQVASPQTITWILRMAAKLAKITDKVAYGFFINVNFVAERVINLARPILGSIMERVEVYGTNEARWKPRILRKLPQDQLPEWYGGSKKFKPLAVYG